MRSKLIWPHPVAAREFCLTMSSTNVNRIADWQLHLTGPHESVKIWSISTNDVLQIHKLIASLCVDITRVRMAYSDSFSCLDHAAAAKEAPSFLFGSAAEAEPKPDPTTQEFRKTQVVPRQSAADKPTPVISAVKSVKSSSESELAFKKLLSEVNALPSSLWSAATNPACPPPAVNEGATVTSIPEAVPAASRVISPIPTEPRRPDSRVSYKGYKDATLNAYPSLLYMLGNQYERHMRTQIPFALVVIRARFVDEWEASDGLAINLDQASEIISRIGLAKRPRDLIALYGADDLAVLLPNTNKTGAFAFRKRMLERLQASPLPDEPKFRQTTYTIGIAAVPNDCDGIAGLLATAEEGLTVHPPANLQVVINAKPEIPMGSALSRVVKAMRPMASIASI